METAPLRYALLSRRAYNRLGCASCVAALAFNTAVNGLNAVVESVLRRARFWGLRFWRNLVFSTVFRRKFCDEQKIEGLNNLISMLVAE